MRNALINPGKKYQALSYLLLGSDLERYTLTMKLIQTLLMAALAGLCFSATAQWQWIDKEGRKVFSDRAPPPDVLDKNILKRPGGRMPTVIPAADVATEGPSGSEAQSPPVGKPTGLDKELEAKKKQAVDAELAKRKADEERLTKARIENCARAKQAKVTLESSARIARTNAAGEREIMDDASRAQEINRIQGIIATDCR
jgi:hypothetical protein